VKQQQAQGQTVSKVKDYSSRELLLQHFSSNKPVKRFPVCEAGFLFFEGKQAIQFDVCSLDFLSVANAAARWRIETQRDQEQHPCQPQRL
jgi:hypothetical protein